MASRQETVDYILEQIGEAGTVSARKMFGEFGIYCDGKFIGAVCDDEFFLKPTEAGKAFSPEQDEGSPYPGAKLHFHITGDQLEDRDWVCKFVRITTDALPAPRPKKKKA